MRQEAVACRRGVAVAWCRRVGVAYRLEEEVAYRRVVEVAWRRRVGVAYRQGEVAACRQVVEVVVYRQEVAWHLLGVACCRLEEVLHLGEEVCSDQVAEQPQNLQL